MLLEPDFFDYNNLIIFTRSANQPEYQLLLHGFMNGLTKESIASLFLNQHDFNSLPIDTVCRAYALKTNEDSQISITLSNKTNEIQAPQELDKRRKNLIIFDDCVDDKNEDIMESYYTRGRHSNCNCIYLSQSYYALPKQSIRNNANFIILFKLTAQDRDLIYRDTASAMIDKVSFKQLTNRIWRNKYAYVVLNRVNDSCDTCNLFGDK